MILRIWSSVVVAAAAAAGAAATLFFRVVGKKGVNPPSVFYRSVIPISAVKQIFLLFPRDFRSTYGPDSSPFFDP